MCMGPPLCRYNAGKAYWVYPHVYGATMAGYPAPRTALGLSPCVWGHPRPEVSLHVLPGSIPMCMGPPRATYQPARLRRVYPHVYGATIPLKQMALLAWGLSPCVWGHHVARCNSCIDYGSIPMCMGPPCRAYWLLPVSWVCRRVFGASHNLMESIPWINGRCR